MRVLSAAYRNFNLKSTIYNQGVLAGQGMKTNVLYLKIDYDLKIIDNPTLNWLRPREAETLLVAS